MFYAKVENITYYSTIHLHGETLRRILSHLGFLQQCGGTTNCTTYITGFKKFDICIYVDTRLQSSLHTEFIFHKL